LAVGLKTKLGAAVAGTTVAAVAALAAIGTVGPAHAALAGGTWGPAEPVQGVAALIPDGEAANGFIRALSCVSPGNCAAVGDYAYTGKTSTGDVTVQLPFAVTETNGTWGSAQAVSGAASLGTGTEAILNLVSCGAAGDCTAAGYFEGSDGKMHAFLVVEANGNWGTATAVDDSGLSTSQETLLTALSCPAAGDCTAVGDSENEGTHVFVPITMDDVGNSWGPPQMVPGLTALSLSATGNAGLDSVSCAAPGDCTAGGLYVSGSGTDQPFIASESGGSATSPGAWGDAQAVPGFSALSGSTDGDATSVSCADATDCAVVGLSGTSTSFGQVFTVDESGGTWGQAEKLSIPGTTLPASYFVPHVSCSPSLAGNCAIVGISSPTGSTASEAEFVATESTSGGWDAAKAVPAIPNGDGSIAYGVSCDPSGSCTVAGNYVNPNLGGGEDYTAVTSADGSVGSAQPLIKAGGGFGTVFLDCTQPGYCTLVDSASDGTPLVLTEGTASTVTLRASGATTYGSEQGEVLTTTVTSTAGGTPTGTVAVTDGSTPVCTINLADGDTCSPSATAIPAGIDTLTATYSGDATYVPATSAATVTVDPAATSASLQVSGLPATFTGTSDIVTFTAGVTSAAAGTPTGSVTFNVNGDTYCSMPLSDGRADCTVSIYYLSAGRNAFSVSYSGDTDFAPSTSATQYLTIARAKTSTTLKLSHSSITYGHENHEKLTVSVSHAGSVDATGRVTIKARSTTVCTITLRNGSGSCTLKSKKLKKGRYTLTARYSGDTNYLNSSTRRSLKVASPTR
jgi:hypothetical protein